MVPPAENEFFDSFCSNLACLLIPLQAVSSKLFFNLDFIIESILTNYKKNFHEFFTTDFYIFCFTEMLLVPALVPQENQWFPDYIFLF